MNEKSAFNMAEDMETSLYISNKIKKSESYAQNMYAALCNNNFIKFNSTEDNKGSWSCSWRSSGSTIATIRDDNTDYADWYCSGIGNEDTLKERNFVPESYITEEIADDLCQIGWHATRDE
jgi:hypothetical protein